MRKIGSSYFDRGSKTPAFSAKRDMSRACHLESAFCFSVFLTKITPELTSSCSGMAPPNLRKGPFQRVRARRGSDRQASCLHRLCIRTANARWRYGAGESWNNRMPARLGRAVIRPLQSTRTGRQFAGGSLDNETAPFLQNSRAASGRFLAFQYDASDMAILSCHTFSVSMMKQPQ